MHIKHTFRYMCKHRYTHTCMHIHTCIHVYIQTLNPFAAVMANLDNMPTKSREMTETLLYMYISDSTPQELFKWIPT